MPVVKTTKGPVRQRIELPLNARILWAIIWRMSIRACVIGTILAVAYSAYVWLIADYQPDPLLSSYNKEQAQLVRDCTAAHNTWQNMPAGQQKDVFRLHQKFRWYRHNACAKAWGGLTMSPECYMWGTEMYRQKSLEARESKLPRALAACRD
jgi:hypothetical protein